MTAALIARSDARAMPLADESVDLVVTSPPYWALRSYTDAGEHYDGQIGDEREMADYLDNLLAVMGELVRVLKPTGSIFVNLADKYASRRRGPNDSSSKLTNQSQHRPRGVAPRFTVPQRSLCAIPQRFTIRCLDELHLTLREDIVWSKPNGLPESIDNRCRRTHEWLLHFTKGATYYADIDAIREPHAEVSIRRAAPCRTCNSSKGPRRWPDEWIPDADPNTFLIASDDSLPVALGSLRSLGLVALTHEWPAGERVSLLSACLLLRDEPLREALDLGLARLAVTEAVDDGQLQHEYTILRPPPRRGGP